jgi:hypothetical protein
MSGLMPFLNLPGEQAPDGQWIISTAQNNPHRVIRGKLVEPSQFARLAQRQRHGRHRTFPRSAIAVVAVGHNPEFRGIYRPDQGAEQRQSAESITAEFFHSGRSQPATSVGKSKRQKQSNATGTKTESICGQLFSPPTRPAGDRRIDGRMIGRAQEIG